MASLPEFVGTVHIFLGPYRGNPIALYLQRDEDETTCHIAPRIYPWNRTVGSGETPNKAAAAFEAKWKAGDLAAEMYSGPHWEGGIKPEKPKPPPKPAAAKPAATPKPATAPATDAAKASAPAASTEKSPAPPSSSTPAAKEAVPSSTQPQQAAEPVTKPASTSSTEPPASEPANKPTEAAPSSGSESA